jgi:hypothetical protein
MTLKIFAAIGVSVCMAVSIGLVIAQTVPPISGQWTIGPALQDYLQLTIRRGGPGHDMSSSSMVRIDQLRGLTRSQLDSAGGAARFDLVRDAGTFQFVGFLQAGSGGGTFTFSPNPGFTSAMGALGFLNMSDEQVFVAAVHDVSSAYVRDLASLSIRAESIDQLIATRIHNVTIDYIRELQSLGYSDLSPDRLVTMRIHSVTTDFVRDLQNRGYRGVSPDQLVTMRIHGVSTDFLSEVENLGYNRPSVDQLVTMRIHGVSPDFIRKTRSMGLGNLSIDQLVNLRIHGLVN